MLIESMLWPVVTVLLLLLAAFISVFPFFWMLVGAVTAGLAPMAPGPLCLACIFKAASTLDSMLGYRRGRLRWLGTAGARLDDGLTWLPCRLTCGRR